MTMQDKIDALPVLSDAQDNKLIRTYQKKTTHNSPALKSGE